MRYLPAVLSLLLVAPLFAASQDETEKRKKQSEADAKLGREYVAEIEKELKLSENKAYVELVQRIGAEIAEIANKHHFGAIYGDKNHHQFEYVFKVVDDRDVNAFSIPGGFIYVNAGLLEAVESDHELAAVISHEVAHAANRHVITVLREQSKVDLLTLPAVLAVILTSPGAAVPALTTAMALRQSLTSGWTQSAELDADRTGFFYMTKSQYNPTAMLTLLERLAFRERHTALIQAEWGIFRTHPPSMTRARKLHELLVEHGIPIERSKVTRSFRATAVESDGVYAIKFGERTLFTLQGESSAERAARAVDDLNKFFDAVPEAFQARAVGNRITGKNQTLIEFTRDDGEDPERIALSALENIRAALFSLSMRTTR